MKRLLTNHPYVNVDIPLSYGIWDDVSKTRRSTTTALHSPMRLHVTSPPRNKEEVAAQIVFKMEPNFKFSTDWMYDIFSYSYLKTCHSYGNFAHIIYLFY